MEGGNLVIKQINNNIRQIPRAEASRYKSIKCPQQCTVKTLLSNGNVTFQCPGDEGTVPIDSGWGTGDGMEVATVQRLRHGRAPDFSIATRTPGRRWNISRFLRESNFNPEFHIQLNCQSHVKVRDIFRHARSQNFCLPCALS